MEGGALLPVSYEAVGEGARLARELERPLCAVAVGHAAVDCAEALAGCGVDTLFCYESSSPLPFRDDLYAGAVIHCVERLRPGIVLFGASPEGRGIAPRVAVHFQTGLTADCTELFLNEKGLLVQVRPAFGGNVMAQIVTEHARPQMLTLRQGVMEPVRRRDAARPDAIRRDPPLSSRIEVLAARRLPRTEDISEAEILLAVGGGVARQSDLPLFADWAQKLGGTLAASRLLVEKGWMPAERQIGLSGRAVAPKLLLLCGISGSVQFRAGIRGAKRIIAINRAADAPIFSAAHEYVVGDMYALLPAVMERLHVHVP